MVQKLENRGEDMFSIISKTRDDHRNKDQDQLPATPLVWRRHQAILGPAPAAVLTVELSSCSTAYRNNQSRDGVLSFRCL